MRVVAILCLVLDVCRRNCDTSLSLFRRLVDGAIFQEFGESFLGLSFRYGSCEGCLYDVSRVQNHTVRGGKMYLSVIDVANSTCLLSALIDGRHCGSHTDVDMRLRSLESSSICSGSYSVLTEGRVDRVDIFRGLRGYPRCAHQRIERMNESHYEENLQRHAGREERVEMKVLMNR